MRLPPAVVHQKKRARGRAQFDPAPERRLAAGFGRRLGLRCLRKADYKSALRSFAGAGPAPGEREKFQAADGVAGSASGKRFKPRSLACS